MFETIVPNKKKSVKIAEQIVQAIKKGKLNPGDKLPAEHDIAQEMGVSRPSVREALSGLQVVGVVETKTGSGTYVSSRASSSHYSDRNKLRILEGQVSHVHIIEARKSIEQAILKIVVSRMDDTGISELQSKLDKMEIYCSPEDYNQYLDADMEFHLKLAQVSRNPLVTKAVSPLISTMRGEVYRELTHKYYLVDSSRLEHCLQIHREIYLALKEKNLARARTQMERHWTLMERALEVDGELVSISENTRSEINGKD